MPLNQAPAATEHLTLTLKTGDVCDNIKYRPLPPVEGPTSTGSAKSIAFDALIHQLRNYAPRHSPSTIAHALVQALPISGNRAVLNAEEDAASTVRNAVFNPHTLFVLGFALTNGQLVSLADDTCDRLPNIEWIILRSEVPVGPTLHPALPATFLPKHFTFALRLPQAPYCPSPLPLTPINSPTPIAPPAPPTPFAPIIPAVPPTPMQSIYRAVATPLARGLATVAAFLSPTDNAPIPATLPATPPPAPTFPNIVPHNLFGAGTILHHTYTGPTNLLASQEIFSQVFPTASTLLCPFQHQHTGHAIIVKEDETTPAFYLHIDKVRLELLFAYLRISYVGSHQATTSDSIKSTVDAIRALQFDPSASPSADGPATTPAGLYERFEVLTPHLPASNCHEWNINLYSEFLNKLNESLRNAIYRNSEYIAGSRQGGIFDTHQMLTKIQQEHALDKLRTIATFCFEDERSLAAIIDKHLSAKSNNSKPPRNNHLSPYPSDPTSNHLGPSAAESTIGRYSGTGQREPYPTIPEYSQFDSLGSPILLDPNTFPSACLGCYKTDHKFYQGECPHYNNQIAKDRMRRNIGHRRDIGSILPKDHPMSKPRHLRTGNNYNNQYNPAAHPPPSLSQYQPPQQPPQQSHHNQTPGLPPGSALQYTDANSNHAHYQQPKEIDPRTPRGTVKGINNAPAWMTNSDQGQAPAPAPAPPPALKKQRTDSTNHPPMIGNIQVTCHNLNTGNRPMPAPINNGLPHFPLPLVQDDQSKEVNLAVMYDSGSAITVGWTPFHLWIFQEHPYLVHSFEKFDDANPFDPIKLHGAISNTASYNEEKYGALNAVIRYFVKPASPDDKPAIVTVALGEDVQVNTILGWPSIEAFGMDLLISQDMISSSVLNNRFKILRRSGHRGFPTNTQAIESYDFFRSQKFQDIRSSLKPQPLLTASDNTDQGYLRRTLTASA